MHFDELWSYAPYHVGVICGYSKNVRATKQNFSKYFRKHLQADILWKSISRIFFSNKFCEIKQKKISYCIKPPLRITLLQMQFLTCNFSDIVQPLLKSLKCYFHIDDA